MKKFKINNFIAFTLSEMMIVILIFSVLSAAILPSIVGKKQQILNTDETPVTRWQGESSTFGNYFQNGNTRIYLGNSATTISSTYVTSPTLILAGLSNKYLSNGRSDIEFFEGNKNVGRIAFDSNKNFSIGKDISLSNTSSSSNTIIGYGAARNGYYLRSVLIGSEVGAHSSNASTSSEDNVVIGSSSLRNHYKDFDVSIGHGAGHNLNGNSSKNYNSNVNIGYEAAYNMYGSESVNIGRNAGYSSSSNSGSDYSVNLFDHAGSLNNSYAHGNVNIYSYAGVSTSSTMSTYSLNLNIGDFAGYDSTVLSGKTNLGKYAGYSASTGTNLGKYAGTNSKQSIGSLYLGAFSGYGTTSGNDSTYIGYRSGYSASGSYNTIIGSYAGHGSSGSYNVYIGYSSGYNASTSYNTYIIPTTGSFTAPTNSRNIAIGYGCKGIAFGYDRTCISPSYSVASGVTTAWDPTGTGSYKTFIAAPFDDDDSNYPFINSVITLYANKVYAGTSTITAFSDKRLKENIKSVEKSLEKVRRINVYEYSMKSDKMHEPHIGVIAQELKGIIPQAVSVNPNTKYFTVDTDWIVYTAMDAVKDLDKIVQNLQSNVKSYVKQLFDLSRLVDSLESRLNKISDSHIVMQAKLQEIDKILSKMENK